MIYTSNMIDEINQKFTPDKDTKIARYMGFDKFKLLVENKNLWFANKKKFMDKNEGAIPESFFNNWNEDTAKNYSTIQKLKSCIYTAYISCWFEYKRESEPMWLAYGGMKKNEIRDSNGICIITDVDKLSVCTSCLDAQIYKISYIDYKENEKVEPPFYFSKNTKTGSTFNGRVFYAYKQKEYSSENEIRAITYKFLQKEGISANINPMKFISNIIINPHASKEQTDLMVNYLERHNLIDKLIESKIMCKLSKEK